jgi:hypothetical protein
MTLKLSLCRRIALAFARKEANPRTSADHIAEMYLSGKAK